MKEVVTANLGDKVIESLGNEFMICNSGSITFRPNIPHGNIAYFPRIQEPYVPYTRPNDFSKPNVQELYQEIHSVFDDFVDIKEDYKTLLAIAVFFTYQQQKSHTTPYLYSVGEKDSGKSRILEIFEYLGYRPLLAATISGANVIQYLEDGPIGICMLCIACTLQRLMALHINRSWCWCMG